LEKNPGKINWSILSSNPNAIQLLEKNQDKIDWYNFLANPTIFEETYEYDVIKEKMDIFKEELICKALHPTNIKKWIESGIDIDDL